VFKYPEEYDVYDENEEGKRRLGNKHQIKRSDEKINTLSITPNWKSKDNEILKSEE